MLSEGAEKKILIVLPTLHAGGSENYALRFIRFSSDLAVDWHVWSADAEHGDLHDLFEEAGCHIHYGSIGYYHPQRFYRFYRFLKQQSFDAVCTFNGNFGGVALTIARLAGVGCRIAWHRRSTNAFGENRFKLLFNKLVNSLVRWHATKILSNSKYALEQFYPGYWEKDSRFKIIPNGVDASLVQTDLTQEEARKQLGVNLNAKIIGNVGRFAPAKNHKTIFQVAAKLIKEDKLDVYFMFCGKYTDSAEFKAQLETYEIADRCFAMGLQENVAIVYRAMDVFYFPSVTEGQPNALIEAMLAGLPVLPSNIAPIKEMFPPERKAITVAPENVEQAAEYLSQIIASDERAGIFRYEEWALKRFNPATNFGIFQKEMDRC